MKVKSIKTIIKNLDDEQEIYVGYDDNNELEFDLFTEQDIIDRANNQAGADDEDCEDRFEDVDSALTYLADMDSDYHFML